MRANAEIRSSHAPAKSMNRSKRALCGLVGTILTVAAYIAFARDTPHLTEQANLSKQDALEDAKLSELRRQVVALGSAHNRLTEEVSGLHASTPMADKGTLTQPKAQPAVPTASPPSANVTGEAQIDVLERALADDGFDPQWSRMAEHELQDALTNLKLPGVELEEASCGSTICRLSMRLGTGSPGIELHRSLFGSVDWEGPRFMRVDADDSQSAVAYFARPGHDLPGP